MTALANILAGQRLTAAMLQGIAPQAAIKPADETVTSSTTLVNDNDLLLVLPASSTWVFVAMLSLTGAAIGSGDFKGQFTVPAGATLIVEAAGYSTSSAGPLNGNSVRSAATTFTAGCNGTSPSPLIILGSLVMSTTPGDLQLQWAQQTSSATATAVKAQSWLAAWQIA